MEPLIMITGYAENYEELCTKIAEPGEFYNVFENGSFMTYCKTEGVEIGPIHAETDVIGWFKNKAELESNIRLTEGEVYITGEYSPYTRWKAQYVDYVLQWAEDGQEERKIVRSFKNQTALTRAKVQPEEEIFYAVGKEAPYEIYGVVSTWEPVGMFITYVVDNYTQLQNKPQKSSVGEIGYIHGIYYVYDGRGWRKANFTEPFENVGEHTYEKNGMKYKLREGAHFGTLEFYAPRDL